MSSPATPRPSGARLRWLHVEFALLFVLSPVLIALLLPPQQMFAALFAVTVLGIGLLHVTPNFSWRDLSYGMRHVDWRFVILFCSVTAATATAVVLTLRPEAFLFLVLNQPGLMVMIALLYPFVSALPLVSALPQEVVFRPLFFRRYDGILPAGVRTRVLLNAALFSLAHLMYWNWVVLAMTFFGGLAFAHAYEIRRNFPQAVILHALAGVIVFALGLGIYFYSGNVVRPF